jgi:hypothetical protein
MGAANGTLVENLVICGILGLRMVSLLVWINKKGGLLKSKHSITKALMRL